jgi:hypothetical protein
MVAKNYARNKGSAGEREFCQWLDDNFRLYEKPKRNLSQTREGGADIICGDVAFEIKRVEKLSLLNWWTQARRAVEDKEGLAYGLEPVVAYKQKYCDWNFLISAKNIGVDSGYIMINQFVFKRWAWKRVEA